MWVEFELHKIKLILFIVFFLRVVTSLNIFKHFGGKMGNNSLIAVYLKNQTRKQLSFKTNKKSLQIKLLVNQAFMVVQPHISAMVSGTLNFSLWGSLGWKPPDLTPLHCTGLRPIPALLVSISHCASTITNTASILCRDSLRSNFELSLGTFLMTLLLSMNC